MSAVPPRTPPPPPARAGGAAKGKVPLWLAVPAALFFLLIGLVAFKQFLMLSTISSEAKAISVRDALRLRVEDYRQKNGAYPADLPGLPPPALWVLTDNPGKKVHLHRLSGVELAPLPPGSPGDSGRWIYDPRTGEVAAGCSGLDGKIRK